MKQKFSNSFLALIVIVSFFSCTKEGRHKTETVNETLNVTLKAGDVYQLDLSKYGDADDVAAIATQAINFTTSEINKESFTGKYTYKYVSGTPTKAGVTTTDKVVIKLTEPQRGGGCNQNNENNDNKDEADITINFTIQ